MRNLIPDMRPRTTIAMQSAAMALIAGVGCTAPMACREFQQIPAPPAVSTAPISSAASVSMRPCPYRMVLVGRLAAAIRRLWCSTSRSRAIRQPLNAPKLMDEFEQQLKRKGLSDPQQMVPLLKEISTDEQPSHSSPATTRCV